MLRTPLGRPLRGAIFLTVTLVAARASAQSTSFQAIAHYSESDGSNTFPSQYTLGPDGMLYGISDASATEFGSIFRVDPVEKTKSLAGTIDFGHGAGADGNTTTTSRLVLAGGLLYGSFIVPSGYSAIFQFDPVTGLSQVVKEFPLNPDGTPGPDGAGVGSVLAGSDGALYGIKMENVPDFSSSVFRFDPITRSLSTLRADTAFGFYPSTVMAEVSSGVWLGTYNDSEPGGPLTRLFRADLNAMTVTLLGPLSDGSFFVGSLTHTADGSVFGVADAFPDSPIFKVDPATGAAQTVAVLANQGPIGDFVPAPDGRLYTEIEEFATTAPQDVLRFDPATGGVTSFGPLRTTPPLMNGLVLGADGRLFAGTSSPYDVYAFALIGPLVVAPASGSLDGSATLSATLTALGVPVPGKTITFAVNGHAAGTATTNAAGIATLDAASLTGIAAGTYPGAIAAAFAGDDVFPAAAGTGSLTVIEPPPPATTATPGLMIGDGFVRDDDFRYDFAFSVREKANGSDRGRLALRVVDTDRRTSKTKKKPKPCNDTFVSLAYTNVVFSDDPTIRPGKRRVPFVDTVHFAGTGLWNGQRGYRFEAIAQDAGEPGRHRESISVTIYDQTNRVVAQFSGDLDGGNIQSVRIHAR